MLVTSTGGKLWRLKYRLGGKEKLLALGAYPDVSLKDARRRRDDARELIAQDVDPGEQKKAVKDAAAAIAKDAALTFKVLADEWFEVKKDIYAISNIKKKQWIIGLLCSHLGDKPISKVAPADILAAIKPVQEAGHLVTAHKMAETAGQICRFARTCGHIIFNPADGLKEALKPIQTKHRPCMTDPVQVGQLLRCIEAYQGSFSILYALKILPYLFLRSEELRGARWAEIDLKTAVWTVPATRRENPKDGGGMKMRIAHEVPLPTQVVKLFNELQILTGNGTLCFPGRQSASQCISDMGLRNALLRMGIDNSEMCIHGFRGMFSTMVNERKLAWGFDGDVIEAALAHKEKDTIRDAYNRTTYLQQRRNLLQKWADFLDSLKNDVTDVNDEPDFSHFVRRNPPRSLQA